MTSYLESMKRRGDARNAKAIRKHWQKHGDRLVLVLVLRTCGYALVVAGLIGLVSALGRLDQEQWPWQMAQPERGE